MWAAATAESYSPLRVMTFLRIASCSSTQAAGADQVLAGGRDLGVGPRQFDLGRSSFLDLRLGVGVQPLGKLDRLLLHLHVLAEADQVDVEAGDAVGGGDQLLREEQARDLPLVRGNANEAAVQRSAEAPQQGLRDGQPEAGGGEGAVVAVERVQRLAAVIERQPDLAAGTEALLNSGIRKQVPSDQGVDAVLGQVVLRDGLMIPVPGPGERGIERRHRRTVRERSRPQNGKVRLDAAQQAQLGRIRGDGGRSEAVADRDQQRAGGSADSHGRLYDVVGKPAQETAAARAQGVRVGQEHAVALKLDVEVVLHRQGHGVLKREVKVAGAHQVAPAAGVLERDGGRPPSLAEFRLRGGRESRAGERYGGTDGSQGTHGQRPLGAAAGSASSRTVFTRTPSRTASLGLITTRSPSWMPLSASTCGP